MALCVTGVVSGAAYKGLALAVRSLTGQTLGVAHTLTGEPALRQTLYRLDVVTLLETLQLLLDDLLGQVTPTVSRIVLGMQSTLTDLQVALQDARARLDYHRGRWWSSWRSYDAETEIIQIRSAVLVLRGQLEMLHQVTGIAHHLTRH